MGHFLNQQGLLMKYGCFPSMTANLRPKVTLGKDINTIDAAAAYDDKEWTMDPNGYVLIRINPETGKIEVGYCKAGNVVLQKFEGNTAKELCQAVLNAGILSRMDHAAYLGRETLKAETAKKLGIAYVQDADLEL
jgi:hypothetical protein